MKKLFHTWLFWIAFFLLSVGCIIVVIKLSPLAFPITHIEVTMDRSQALREARNLSEQASLGPKTYKEAVSFDTDFYVNTFMELEGGGKEALVKIMNEGLYEPYSWNIRHYNPLDVHELSLRFTPTGRPYGFIETIPEDMPGPQLKADEARRIAETTASETWNLSFAHYELVESAKHENPNKRIDHIFVYERKDAHAQEGRFRLRLVVSGERLSELTHFVQVPDEFARRYEEMRSLNDRIAWMSNISIVVLYGLGCIFIGLYLLIKERWLLWRKPVLWALIIALLNLLSYLNNFPTLWFEYNTALDPTVFIANTLLLMIFRFLAMWAVLSIIFAAAEALTRKAFPHQLQLSTIWQKSTANSPTVVGQSFAGYLLVPFSLAFQAAFYVLTARYFHWWIPSEALVNPNILGTFAPWLTPFTQALTAGSMEECLFRAVPLASAALLGNRFGHRKLFIAGAFILQAIIFGAAHANYPMQPAYARLVELLVPSMIFGALYLAFGLLPAIINHFIFDLVLMSLPLFLSSGSAIVGSQAMLVLLGLIPLWVVFSAILKERGLKTPVAKAYNASFVPPPPKESIEKTATLATSLIRRRALLAASLLGAMGAIAWIYCTPFNADAPAMVIDREDAIAKSREYLAKIGLHPDDRFTVFTKAVNARGELSLPEEFIWEKGGKKLYERLLGTVLDAPHWQVRFALFTGTVEERAEEYLVNVDAWGRINNFDHLLPQARAIPSLSEEEARRYALDALKHKLSIDTKELVEVSAVASRFAARTDWLFVWNDPRNYPLKEGRAQLSLRIAGNELASLFYGLHLPEDWVRQKNEKEQKASIVFQIALIPLFMVFFAGLIFAFKRLLVSAYVRKLWALSVLTLAIPLFANTFNNLPSLLFSLSTTRSFDEQIIIALFTRVVVLIIVSAVFGLALAYIFSFASVGPRTSAVKAFLGATAMGVFLSGMEAMITSLVPAKIPFLADINPINAYVPMLSELTSVASPFLSLFVFIMLVLTFIKLRLREKPHYGLYALSIFALCGFFSNIATSNVLLYFSLGLTRAAVFVAFWYLLVRHDHTLVPFFVASYYAMILLQQGLIAAFPYSLLNALACALIIAATSIFFFLLLRRKQDEQKI